MGDRSAFPDDARHHKTTAGSFADYFPSAGLWNGAERQVSVLATGKRPLLGTALLDDQELRVRFRENDLVTVDAL